MSKLSKRFAGAGMSALAVFAAAHVNAADLAYPLYPGDEPGLSGIDREERIDGLLRPLPPRPFPTSRFAGHPYVVPPEACRTIIRRRIDEDGDDIERRIRICDGPVHPLGPRFRPSFYPTPPLPPADVPYVDRPGLNW